MRQLHAILAILFLGAVLGACGGDPLKPAVEAIKASDWAKAEATLDAVVLDKPDLKAAHALRLVLFRHLMVNGPQDKHDAYVGKAVIEYDALVKALGLKPDYADMEASLRGNPEGAALLAAARKPLYGN